MKPVFAWGLTALLVTLATAVSSASAADFGVAKFEAGTCNSDAPPVAECSYTAPESQFYTQAAGHPPIGLTGFEVNTEPSGLLGNKKPIGNVKDVRVDIPPGLSVNPQATCSGSGPGTCAEKGGQCTQEQFKQSVVACPATSKVGEDEIDGVVAGVGIEHVSVPMYDLVPPEGVPAEFGLDVELGPVKTKIVIVGGLSWYHEAETSEDSGVTTGDYHEYFTIKEVPKEIEIVKTRLKFTGTAGSGTFITLPSVCNTQTSYLHVDSYTSPGEFLAYPTLSGYPPKAISVGGCDKVPFAPDLSLSPGKSEEGPDKPDGITTDLHVPQSESAAQLNSSDVQNASVTLPEGLTMNPSAAHSVQACTSQQIKIGTNQTVECPKASEIGTVEIDTSMLPAKALQGSIYLAAPSGTPITGPPYAVYVAAESKQYGVGVRLQGTVTPNPQTGQLTTTFENAPPLPFDHFVLHFNGGEHAPLANPLVCVPQPLSSLTPYTASFIGGGPASVALGSPFSVGTGSLCSSSAPFSLSQNTQSSSSSAAAHTSFTLNLSRAEGQQYPSRVSTVLPAGLVGPVPAVTLCGEPQAKLGSCSEASRIGTANVTAGSGDPYPFSGPVYLTGPYEGAPYGLSIPVAANAGPFALGTLVTRAQINVDPHTARLIVSSVLPSVFQGVPLRLRQLSVTVDRAKFLFNPTNCGALSTDTTLTSTMGAIQTLSSPFQVTGCGSLPFKPKFTVSKNAQRSRMKGVTLTVKLTQSPGEANIREVHAELPKLLPARLTTLQKACVAATFEANPASCPAASKVGKARVSTPVLAGKLTGPAYLVSHGGVAFPDLEMILTGDGVTVILDGRTNIKSAITSSAFSSVPDVPINSFELTLPSGRYSALGATGELCSKKLIMPTTIVSQNSKTIKQNTKISVQGCPPRIITKTVRANTVTLRVAVPAGGRISAGGGDLTRASKRLAKAGHATLKMTLSKKGLVALGKKGKLKVRLLVSFIPKTGAHSKIHTELRFR